MGDRVLVECEKTKKWLFKGTITEQVEEDSYNVKLKKPNGPHEKIYLRNRSMLKDPAVDSDDQTDDHDDSDTPSGGIRNMKLRSSSKKPQLSNNGMKLRSHVRFTAQRGSRERSVAAPSQRLGQQQPRSE